MPRRQPETTVAQAPLSVHLRWMIRIDWPAVLAIEAASFEYPWSEDDLLRVLRRRNCIGMVAEHGERVVGFMVYELCKQRIHVLDLAVDPEFRRRDVGGQMVAKLVDKLATHQRTRLVLMVRETGLAGQLFLRAQKFRATKVLRDHYEDNGEAAYVMQYALDGAPVIPAYATEWDGTREC